MEGLTQADLSSIDEFYAQYQEMRDRALLGDRDGLPAESFENFSEAPLTFEEMAAGMRADLEKVYTLTGNMNRYSADYPTVCRQLERMIRRVGSCCVTKAVLEQKGFEFKSLDNLNVKDLYCMVSFNFRKTRTAYHDSERMKDCADMGLLELECRWVDLAEQLKATEEKIRLIRTGKLNADRMLERADLFKGEQPYQPRSSNVRAFPEKGRALPVIGSVARQMIAERRAEKKAREEMTKPLHGARPFQEARPFPPAKAFTTGEFRPLKEMKALALLDEEAEEDEQQEMLEKFSRGEISATGMPVLRKQQAHAGGKEQPMTEEEMDLAMRLAWAEVMGTPPPAIMGGKSPGRE